jgi:hypothetical protein
MSKKMGLAIHRPKDKVVVLRSRRLEMGAPLCSLLELDDHLSYNTHLGNIDGKVPENGSGG